MNNNYKLLCDSVGAYTNTVRLFEVKDLIKIYPPATAEQIERLLELIKSKTKFNIRVCGLYHFTSNGVEALEHTFSDLIYRATSELVAEDILSKEEVAKALKGGE